MLRLHDPIKSILDNSDAADKSKFANFRDFLTAAKGLARSERLGRSAVGTAPVARPASRFRRLLTSRGDRRTDRGLPVRRAAPARCRASATSRTTFSSSTSARLTTVRWFLASSTVSGRVVGVGQEPGENPPVVEHHVVAAKLRPNDGARIDHVGQEDRQVLAVGGRQVGTDLVPFAVQAMTDRAVLDEELVAARASRLFRGRA